jgi:hypothetical protein
VPDDSHGNLSVANTFQLQVVLAGFVHEDHCPVLCAKRDARDNITKLMQRVMEVRRGHIDDALREGDSAGRPPCFPNFILHAKRHSPAKRTGVQLRAPEAGRRPTDKLVSCNALLGGVVSALEIVL